MARKSILDNPIVSAIVENLAASDIAIGQCHPQLYNAAVPANERAFVVWDGEGITDIKNCPQDYVLFGCYNGVTHEYITGKSLTTKKCLDFIIEQGRANPNAYHIGFAFGYDINMILRNLRPKDFESLRIRGRVHAYGYRIEHVPSKWLRVSTTKKDLDDYVSVMIQDVWGFFQTSFVKALKANVPEHPLMARLPEIEAGKNKRSQFTRNDMVLITEYWKIENELMHVLVNRLREMLYDSRVNLQIKSWYGPGALAGYTYHTYGIAKHKSESLEPVYNASRYAYAGGRFELFRAGRFEGVYGIDINSAYPHAISQLPSLSEGEWRYVENPTHIVEFGIYHVTIDKRYGPLKIKTPGPLFHRDKSGNISFPWSMEGWYWSPEIAQLRLVMPTDRYKILEGWEYVGWNSRPFEFVKDMYNQRKRMKDEGIGAQMALKLCLNSLYGKMAQRSGWERTGKAPKWHQLEWAGWVTSFTRAQLYDVIRRLPHDKLIGVETDGIYITENPANLGIYHSKNLGEWEITPHDEMYYLQSGVYAIKDGRNWSMKYRGLDANSVTPQRIANHTLRMKAGMAEWPSLVGTTTRFIGYRSALQMERWHEGSMKLNHRVWKTESREISIGGAGKRQHRHLLCNACRKGANAYEMPHDLFVTSKTWQMSQSFQHYIPWLDSARINSAEQLADIYESEDVYVG